VLQGAIGPKMKIPALVRAGIVVAEDTRLSANIALTSFNA